jgi:hypothetical protein
MDQVHKGRSHQEIVKYRHDDREPAQEPEIRDVAHRRERKDEEAHGKNQRRKEHRSPRRFGSAMNREPFLDWTKRVRSLML